MKLDDARLEQTTGFVIAKGSLQIGSKTCAAAIDDCRHNHLLIVAQRDMTTVWPVTEIKRDEYGFCEVTLGEIGLAFRPLSLSDIANLSPPEPKSSRRSLLRGGSKLGEVRQRVRRGNGWTDKPGSSIQSYDLVTEYGLEGLHVAFSGQVAVTAEGPEPFSIDATISWSTLSVKGIWPSVAYWKFEPRGSPSKSDALDRVRNPKNLNDLLLPAGLTWPYLKGRISFTPEPSSSWLVHDFVYVNFWEQISFGDAPKLEVLDTGFAQCFGSSRYLNIAMFDGEKLERIFQRRDSISMRLEGDAIGSVRYRTPYAEEAGDPLGWIEQAIRAMSLKMVLGTNGLEISADGELDDFDPVEFATHREERNSHLKPLHAYSLQATMPWALLVARGFSFARRAQDF